MVRWERPGYVVPLPVKSPKAKALALAPRFEYPLRAAQGLIELTVLAWPASHTPPVRAVSAVDVPKNELLFARAPFRTALLLFTPSWNSVEHPSLTQLGVNATNGLVIGGLASKPSFFGSNTAETVSIDGVASGSSWNKDYAESPRSAEPWYLFGATANQSMETGLFSAGVDPGGTIVSISHRTILSGY